MSNEHIIFSNRFHRTTLEELDEAMKQEKIEMPPDIKEKAAEFVNSIGDNLRMIPNEERIAQKEEFLNTVRTLSDVYKIDTDVKEIDGGYSVSMRIRFCAYSGYSRKLIALLFCLADDVWFLSGDIDEKNEVLICFTYHTHNIYYKDREVTDFS